MTQDGIQRSEAGDRGSAIRCRPSAAHNPWSVVRGLAVAAVLVGFATAATRDAPETWDSGSVEAWTRWDPLNGRTVSLANPGNYLQVVFSRQSKSFPQVHIVRADVNASGGAFASDYLSAGITNVTFKVYCGSHQPADLRLYFCSKSGNWWYYPLNKPNIGQWADYSVPLEYWAGWKLGDGASSKKFKRDLKNVEWIGIVLQRNSSTAKQVYGVDNFVLYGADRTKDSDSDGMNDWAEFLAGTNPNDPNSALVTEIASTNMAGGIVLRWRSVANRTYAIPRATNLIEGFKKKVATGIPATPPVNVYIDRSATNEGPYFYRIEMEE